MINAEPVEDPVDHPIWYIRTEGLEQSVVNSIWVVKYKKDEGLVEGADCAICLSLRRWFRSHKNCPLCRSLIPDVNSWLVFSMEDLQEEVWRRPLELENQENGGPHWMDSNQLKRKVRIATNPAESQKVTDKEVQPTRRSVSADPATALGINEAAADINLNANPGAEA
ncbi:hypothetical protein QQ045_010077 [Rhodiola kirilowii]